MNENNQTDIPKTLYYAGEMLNMLLVFDPVTSDLQRLDSADMSVLNHHRPSVREDNSAYEGKTGKQQLLTVDGMVSMLVNMFNGTGLVKDVEGLNTCDESIRQGIIGNGMDIAEFSQAGDHFGALFAFWDMTYNIHPMFLNCRSWMYDFGTNTAAMFNTLDDIRRIIVNIVNHIDEIIDIGQDLKIYLTSDDPNHSELGPSQAGLSMGHLIYYSISKNNDEPFFDPAANMELGEVPWAKISDLVKENKEKSDAKNEN